MDAPDDQRQDDRTSRIGRRDLTAWPSAVGRAAVRITSKASSASRRWLDERSIPLAVLLVTAAIGVLIAGIFTVLSAKIYESVTDRGGVAGLDRPVLDWMVDRRSAGLNTAVSDYTDLGGTVVMPVIATVAAVALALWWRRWTPILLMAVAAGGSVLLTVIGKQSIDRARPPQQFAVAPFETSPSFPSGHTLNSWVILLLIAYLISCRVESRGCRISVTAVAVVLAVAMGLSRVYLGHHWLTDVLVGWTLGSAWLIVVVTGHRLALTMARRPPDRPVAEGPGDGARGPSATG